MTPNPPCRVGDLVQDEHWPTWPCVVLAVVYIGEPTEEEREEAEWLGYWLRPSEPHWALVLDEKRKARRSNLNYDRVELKLDAEGRMVHCVSAWGTEPEHISIIGHTEDYTPLARSVDDTEEEGLASLAPACVQGELFA